ncbi:MAG: DNA photolyase, partial [Opitutales bacterium]
MFLPSKSAACKALEAFLPKAGRDYAGSRNYDTGAGGESTVSKLSPWIRVRLLPEWEVLHA